MRWTMIGWITPCSLMDAASSLSRSSLKVFRGWNSFGTILSSSISMMPRAFFSFSPSTERSGIRAPSPLPSACFCMAQHLFCKIKITLGAARPDVVEQDRLAVARRFAQGHVAMDHGFIHLAAEILAHFIGHLLGKVVPAVEHRQQHTLDLELGIQVL